MKNIAKRVLAAVMALVMVFAFSAVAFADGDYSTPSDKKLKFKEDGSFRILQFADTQDDMFASPGMLHMIKTALEKYKPDLVVFTGDNTATVDTKIDCKYALESILSIVNDAKIPFTLVFGNHDAENVPKEYHMSCWRSYEYCLAYDADPAIYGMGTHNLPVYASKGNKVAYNIWMFDSNMYDDVNGGYDYIHEDQLNWYADASNALKAANGGEPVPSIAFQHIVPYEIYDYVIETPTLDPNGFTSSNGKHYALDPAYAQAGSILREYPCPSSFHGNQMSVLQQQGDVNAVFVGHDHVNDYIVHTKLNAADGNSIDIVNTPGASFQSYGNNEMRGCRVIDINENDPWNYETFSPTFFEICGGQKDMHILAYVSDNIAWYYVSLVIKLIPFVGERLQGIFLNLVYDIATK
ncbi:MAG: metallophosphoesterase [Clostridia bacterium]|nr:metallophosphoesterase [Clostridia bacterium]